MPLVRVSNGGTAKLGEIVYANISGSHTYIDYPFEVCYVSESKICLFGTVSLGDAVWLTQHSYRWNVAIKAGQPVASGQTFTDVMIPFYNQIAHYCANWVGNRASYWMDDGPAGGQIYCMIASQYLWYTSSVNQNMGTYPFIEIQLT